MTTNLEQFLTDHPTSFDAEAFEMSRASIKVRRTSVEAAQRLTEEAKALAPVVESLARRARAVLAGLSDEMQESTTQACGTCTWIESDYAFAMEASGYNALNGALTDLMGLLDGVPKPDIEGPANDQQDIDPTDATVEERIAALEEWCAHLDERSSGTTTTLRAVARLMSMPDDEAEDPEVAASVENAVVRDRYRRAMAAIDEAPA